MISEQEIDALATRAAKELRKSEPKNVLALWALQRGFDEGVTPTNVDAMLDAFYGVPAIEAIMLELTQDTIQHIVDFANIPVDVTIDMINLNRQFFKCLTEKLGIQLAE